MLSAANIHWTPQEFAAFDGNQNVSYPIHKAQQWILTQATLVQLHSISENTLLNSISPPHLPTNTQICHVVCTFHIYPMHNRYPGPGVA
jgi:hypothetical protein